MPELDPEDAKIVTLASAARTRVGAAEGATVRDDTGRTYAGVTVTLPSLTLSALQTAVATAVSSGARALEAAALVTEAHAADEPGLAALRDLAGETVVLVADGEGEVHDSFTA